MLEIINSKSLYGKEAERRLPGVFPAQGRHLLITDDSGYKMAMDSISGASSTIGNVAIPVLNTTYINPKAIDVLYAPFTANLLFESQVRGDWTSTKIQYTLKELTTAVASYGDYSNLGESSYNLNYIYRDIVLFQSNVSVGDLQLALSSKVFVDAWGASQEAAIRSIKQWMNYIYFNGSSGQQIYGILTDPSLSSYLTPTVGAGSAITWVQKSLNASTGANEMYADIVKLVTQLSTQLKGNGYTEKTVHTMRLKLAVSPARFPLLATVNSYGVSAQTMINRFYPNMDIVVVPEMELSTGTNLLYLIADEVVRGERTGYLVNNVNYRSHGAVRGLSSLQEKVSAGTSGFHCIYPIGISRMTGI